MFVRVRVHLLILPLASDAIVVLLVQHHLPITPLVACLSSSLTCDYCD